MADVPSIYKEPMFVRTFDSYQAEDKWAQIPLLQQVIGAAIIVNSIAKVFFLWLEKNARNKPEEFNQIFELYRDYGLWYRLITGILYLIPIIATLVALLRIHLYAANFEEAFFVNPLKFIGDIQEIQRIKNTWDQKANSSFLNYFGQKENPERILQELASPMIVSLKKACDAQKEIRDYQEKIQNHPYETVSMLHRYFYLGVADKISNFYHQWALDQKTFLNNQLNDCFNKCLEKIDQNYSENLKNAHWYSKPFYKVGNCFKGRSFDSICPNYILSYQDTREWKEIQKDLQQIEKQRTLDHERVNS
jgi:hypothetical protein